MTIHTTLPQHSQEEPPTLGDHGGFPIYPMPAFVSLTASDIGATVRFFTEALDFAVMFSGPEIDGVPMLVHLRRARYQDVLVRQGDAGGPSSSLVVAFAAADAEAVDALGARVAAAGGTIVSPAADTPWHTHELTVADPDGHRFTFTARAASHQPRDFDRTMREVAERLR
jgi:predicted lactoylglutathione lyase